MIELQVGVKVFLRNGSGKYLLVRRSSEKYPEVVGSWDIVGGRINPGATLLENLKREIREEISLELEGEPTLVAAQDILRVPGRHVVRLTYVGRILGEPRLNGENVEFRWFTLDELKTHNDLDVYFRELLDRGAIG